MLDDVKVGSVGPGEPLGELALMYGARRPATVVCRGPCEVFSLNRAAYDSGISILPVAARVGPFVTMMQRYWDLVTGPDGSRKNTFTSRWLARVLDVIEWWLSLGNQIQRNHDCLYC
jgi:hypothetical protein